MTTLQDIRELLDQTPAEDLPPLTEALPCHLTMPEQVAERLSIAEVAALVEVSTHTLRYYERIGLVRVGRDAAGHRSYDRESLGRVIFITRLRLSDLPIRDIQRYIALVDAGEGSVPERLALLEGHRDSVRQRIADLQFALAVIDYKITTYGGALRD